MKSLWVEDMESECHQELLLELSKLQRQLKMILKLTYFSFEKDLPVKSNYSTNFPQQCQGKLECANLKISLTPNRDLVVDHLTHSSGTIDVDLNCGDVSVRYK